MTGRMTMILASAVLAGTLFATGAQARGGGGHMGGGGGAHMGGFGGAHMGGFGGAHMAGFGGGHVGFAGGHFAGGRRIRYGNRYAGGDYGLGCPYYPSDSWPYSCNYW